MFKKILLSLLLLLAPLAWAQDRFTSGEWASRSLPQKANNPFRRASDGPQDDWNGCSLRW